MTKVEYVRRRTNEIKVVKDHGQLWEVVKVLNFDKSRMYVIISG